MLRLTKPDIPEKDYYVVLEEMHRQLFIAEREGSRPESGIKVRRRAKILEILSDPRLKNCIWFSEASVETFAQLPYPKLLSHAKTARRIIQDAFLFGRNWEMVMKCSRKSPRWKTYGSTHLTKITPKRGGRIPQNPIRFGSGFERILAKLDFFLGRADQVAFPNANYLILRDEIRTALRDKQFRNCYWYRPYTVGNDDELLLVADQARGTIRAFLERRNPNKPKKTTNTKGKRNGKVKKRTSNREGGTRTDEVQPAQVHGEVWPFPRS